MFQLYGLDNKKLIKPIATYSENNQSSGCLVARRILNSADIYSDIITTAALGVGGHNITTNVLPNNYIYEINSISVQWNGGTINYFAMSAKHLGTTYYLLGNPAHPANVWLNWTGSIYLAAGDSIELAISVTVAGTIAIVVVLGNRSPFVP